MRILVWTALILDAGLLVLYFTLGGMVALLGDRALWLTYVFSALVPIATIVSIAAIIGQRRRSS